MLRSMQKFALLLIIVFGTGMAAWVGLLRACPYNALRRERRLSC